MAKPESSLSRLEQQQQPHTMSLSGYICTFFDSVLHQSSVRNVMLFWIGMYTVFCGVNLMIVYTVGGRWSEVVTIVMIVFLIGYHYIFQPSLCGTAKSDGEMQPEEENKENEGKERTEKGEEAPEESPAGTVSVLLKSEEQAAPSEETETNATSEVVAEDILNMKDSSNVKSNANKNKKRMAFLDNTKIFLTALVVSHHTTCAFGGCRTTSWYLVVAMDGNPYCQSFLRAFATLNQAYFMPLFFFLSALFVPSSYDKIGPDKFLKNKRHRLLIPGCLTWVTICPACMVLQQVVRDNYDEIFFIFLVNKIKNSVETQRRINSKNETKGSFRLKKITLHKTLSKKLTPNKRAILGLSFFFEEVHAK